MHATTLRSPRPAPLRRLSTSRPPAVAGLPVQTAQEDPRQLLRESTAALVRMDAARLQELASRAVRAEKFRAWNRLDRREQAALLAERALFAALLAETRRNLSLLKALGAPAVDDRASHGAARYAAVGGMWAD